MFDFFFFFSDGCRRRNLLILVANCQHADKKSARATIDARSRHRLSPRTTRLVTGKANEYRWRPRRYQVDQWSRRRELAGGVLRYPPKPGEKNLFFAIRDGSRNCVIYFVHTSGQLLFYHTPGQRPPYVTGYCVNTVTLGWVGAPNERTPFKFHDAVVGFVDRCLSRTRKLAASNHTNAWVFLTPVLAHHRPHNCFFRAFPNFGLSVWRNVPIASCTQNNYDGYLGNSIRFNWHKV